MTELHFSFTPLEVEEIRKANEQYELNHSSEKRSAKEIINFQEENKEAMRKLLRKNF